MWIFTKAEEIREGDRVKIDGAEGQVVKVFPHRWRPGLRVNAAKNQIWVRPWHTAPVEVWRA